MKAIIYYLVMFIEILTIIVCYNYQGYNFNYPCYTILLSSLTLLIFVKISIFIICFYSINYTRIFYNRYFYILLKIYIVLVIYNIIKNSIGVIQ